MVDADGVAAVEVPCVESGGTGGGGGGEKWEVGSGKWEVRSEK